MCVYGRGGSKRFLFSKVDFYTLFRIFDTKDSHYSFSLNTLAEPDFRFQRSYFSTFPSKMLTYKASLLANRISGRISALLTIHLVKRCFLSINDTAFEEVISPLVDLKKFAQSKRLCDEQGLRLPDTHWSFVISASVSFDEVSGMSWHASTILSH